MKSLIIYCMVMCCMVSSVGARPYYWKHAPPEFMYGRSAPEQWIYANNDKGRFFVMLFNVGFGCLKGGIGTEGSFWRGCSKGALGGIVAFAGEQLASNVHKHLVAGTIGVLVNDLGVSMQDNAMDDLGLFERYQTEVGPITLAFQRGKDIRWTFSAVSLVGIGVALGYGGRFSLNMSLAAMGPVFVTDKFPVTGAAIGTTILISGDSMYRHTLSHELNHSLAWSDVRFCGERLAIGPWELGRDATGLMLALPSYIPRTYDWSPIEWRAMVMER